MNASKNSAPRCIGVIMDGNRRWAKAKGLPTLEGHRAGYEKLREVSRWCKEAGVKSLIVYAFSTENWNRAKEEVGYLMNLFREVVGKMTEDALEGDTRLVFLGERGRFDADILGAIKDAERRTRDCGSFTFGIALSYGGRAEILDAIRRVPKEKLATLSEEEFSKLLWTKDIPDPDLIVRTSGEERLSGFLPWQGVYSELFFTDTLWPAFTREEFDRILGEYGKRERRLGK
ncbi:MAG: di-trans,poly-cis-decaprenylcistransferase [Candidatus Lloydbacteria bacterium RIFCSPHIGHO2_02_FULL_54_17]|uniref:Isoprenyl transferase n=1 Tax=Candidatus Lloydbacteria bacterium RIFCSPHIGHO2_02_FULL_54_17 TaxID=1798664 RepID=A0A1G2DHW4_9BACT|nr:MAG: di-trans,poly-cis-decaprenylcistransferase [Candidatus Lloydbacteria bacterium RIFCSPHIGHO2_01_FULL_54_11]OGZ13012.1 MAG: di-trans,poly-cis-decaprenylcistransferase [Candidatus Lloydbacteria bacterium RIFCSPHIGHO2_02_FULL_54_17]OGZ15247.1 MAG: di-trans,poly-cis-decaprenylcistransferase [Candidatus Lloydbacteria bacterium RIFCSPLOWO2_01_FULL_54_18]